jgi:Flp pilus assembly protein TadG
VRWRIWGEVERGAALVELALVLPMLVLLVAGVAATGDALNAYLSVVNASRDGARLAVRAGADDEAIRSLVLLDLRRLRDPTTAGDIAVTRTAQGGASSVRVRVCHDHRLVVRYPLLGIPNPLRMCASTTMRLTR